jgi:hypothetical protein
VDRTDVPEYFIKLGEDGWLISEDWHNGKIPPAPPSWMDQQVHGLRAFFREKRWRGWDQQDWINAILYCGLGLAVLQNLVTVFAEVRRATTPVR